jgi:hypothetical protein
MSGMLTPTKKHKNQKNSKGSHSPESMASPDHTILKHKHTSKALLKRNLVDLTTEEQEPEKIHSPQLPPPKKQGKTNTNVER